MQQLMVQTGGQAGWWSEWEQIYIGKLTVNQIIPCDTSKYDIFLPIWEAGRDFNEGYIVGRFHDSNNKAYISVVSGGVKVNISGSFSGLNTNATSIILAHKKQP